MQTTSECFQEVNHAVKDDQQQVFVHPADLCDAQINERFDIDEFLQGLSSPGTDI